MFFIDFSTLIPGNLEDINYNGVWDMTHRLVINEDAKRLHLTFCYLAGMLRIANERLLSPTPDRNDRSNSQLFTIPRLLWSIVMRIRIKTWETEGKRGNVMPTDYAMPGTDMKGITELMLDKITALSDEEFANWMVEETKRPRPFPTVAKLRSVKTAP